jgi:hypothetical protein
MPRVTDHQEHAWLTELTRIIVSDFTEFHLGTLVA